MNQIEATVEKPKSKSKTTKPRPNHPTYLEMVITAIKELDDSRRTGSSKQAITKYINENNEIDPSKSNQYINAALRNGVTSGRLTQLKGKGAYGSFRLGEESGESTKKKTHATRPAKKQEEKKQPKAKATTKEAAKAKTKSAPIKKEKK